MHNKKLGYIFDASNNDTTIKMNFRFEDSVGYYLNRTAMVMRNSLQRAFNLHYPEITIDHWVILNRLWVKDGWNQSELAEMTDKDNASMTRMLDGMQRKGLVERRPDENDRRAQRIFLTGRGRSLEQPLKKIAKENMMKGLKNIPEGDVQKLKKILDLIVNNY